MRQQLLLQSYDEDVLKFEAFGVVERHQLERFVLVFDSVEVGLQRHEGEEVGKQCGAVVLFSEAFVKLAGGVHKLHQVFRTGDVLGSLPLR